eukprot:Em0007g525a
MTPVMGWKKSEVAVFITFLPVFFSLLFGPLSVYLYFSNHQIPTSQEITLNNTNPPNTTQCQQQPYSGICLGPLLSCFSPSTVATSIQITSSVDIQTNEALASKIIVLLNSAYPSCLTGAHRFLCQYLFPLCDGNGTLYQPTYQECLNVSQGVCSVAWTQGPAAGVSLPVCLDLPNTTSICNANATEVSFQPALTCSDHYYFNGSVCLAQCGVWEQFPSSLVVGIKGTELFAALFGSLSQIALIAMFIHQRKRISKFPSIFMVYHTVCYFIIMFFVAINHIVPYSSLFCSAKSIVETIAAKPTSFCTLSGIVLQYFLPSMCWWWIFHIFGVFWTFVFPSHAKRHASRVKMVYWAMVVCGFVLPLPGVIATLATDGYAIGRFPPLLCTTKNPNLFYYYVVFLASAVLSAGLFMLVVLYWTLYKHKRFLKAHNASGADESGRHTLLLGVLTYYIVFGSLLTVQQSLELSQSGSLKTAVAEAFRCEGLGTSANCTANYDQYSYPRLSGLVYVLMGLIPAVHMVFVLPAKRMWRYCVGDKAEDKNVLLKTRADM